MANQNGDKRENLEDFEARFGSLSDRMEGVVHPEVQQEEMPRAELQSRVDEREAANDPGERPGGEFLPDESVQQPFQNAVENFQPGAEGQGQGSVMVKEEGAENNLPPPENTQEVDREVHEDRMSADDDQSRRGYSEEYLAELSQDVQEAGYGREAEQDQSQANDGQVYEHDR